MDSGFYPPQMERRDWSHSFVYVTNAYMLIEFDNLKYQGYYSHTTCIPKILESIYDYILYRIQQSNIFHSKIMLTSTFALAFSPSESIF